MSAPGKGGGDRPPGRKPDIPSTVRSLLGPQLQGTKKRGLAPIGGSRPPERKRPAPIRVPRRSDVSSVGLASPSPTEGGSMPRNFRHESIDSVSSKSSIAKHLDLQSRPYTGAGQLESVAEAGARAKKSRPEPKPKPVTESVAASATPAPAAQRRPAGRSQQRQAAPDQSNPRKLRPIRGLSQPRAAGKAGRRSAFGRLLNRAKKQAATQSIAENVVVVQSPSKGATGALAPKLDLKSAALEGKAKVEAKVSAKASVDKAATQVNKGPSKASKVAAKASANVDGATGQATKAPPRASNASTKDAKAVVEAPQLGERAASKKADAKFSAEELVARRRRLSTSFGKKARDVATAAAASLEAVPLKRLDGTGDDVEVEAVDDDFAADAVQRQRSKGARATMPNWMRPKAYLTSAPVHLLRVRVIVEDVAPPAAPAQRTDARQEMIARRRVMLKEATGGKAVGKADDKAVGSAEKKGDAKLDAKADAKGTKDSREKSGRDVGGEAKRGARKLNNGDKKGDNGVGGATDEGAEAEAVTVRRRASEVFEWQRKVFSPRELVSYTHGKQIRGEQDAHYAAEVHRQLRSQYPELELAKAARRACVDARGVQLCTKVDVDAFAPVKVLGGKLTTSRASGVRRRLAKDDGLGAWKPGCVRMYIVAALDLPDDDVDIGDRIGDEVVVAEITKYDNGTLVVRPDFSKPDEWYPLTSRLGHAWRMRFELENGGGSDKGAEPDSQLRQLERTILSRRAPAPVRFEPPPPARHTRLAVFGQVTRATGFGCDTLFARLELSLPKGWLVNPSAPKSCMREGDVTTTHASECAVVRRENGDGHTRAHHLGWSVELDLIGVTDGLLQSPTVSIQLVSIDYFGCQRIEGYASWNIPVRPGRVVETLPAWKPLGTREAQLREFFVGAKVGVCDSKDAAGPAPENATRHHDRSGFVTRRAGEIVVEANAALVAPPVEQPGSGQPRSRVNLLSAARKSRVVQQAHDVARSPAASKAKKAFARGVGKVVTQLLPPSS